METQTKNKESRIERGMTKVVVPHGKSRIAFAWPSQGPHTYQTVAKGLLARGLRMPMGDYTASLIHATYCDSKIENEPETEEIREIMRTNWLWVFNRNLWTPEGVYVIPDTKGIGRSQPLDQGKLENSLRNAKEINGIRFTRNVRFASKGSYKLGEHTSESLAKDGFVVASYGVEGAEKLGEASASKHLKYNPRTFGVNVEKGQASEQRLSALYDDDGRLGVIGGWVGGNRCRAFGVVE